VTKRIDKLTAIAHRVGYRLTLDELLRLVTDGAAELTGATRTSCRLLNPSRTKLIAASRTGSPLHQDPSTVFTVGEGLIGWVAQRLRPLRTGNAEQDPRFTKRPGMKEPMGSFVGVPMVVGATCVGVLSAVHGQADYFGEEDERLLLLLATMAAPHVDIARLSQLSPVDRLTGVLNRGAFDRFLAEDADEDATLCVAMVDVDHLDLVNERFGHAVGDQVLRGVAERLSAAAGGRDAVMRCGGEEFLLLLADQDLDEAQETAAQLCRDLARSPAWAAPVSVTVTASVGVAARRADEPRAELVRRAEQAMSEAKDAGGNCVVRAAASEVEADPAAGSDAEPED
jgi:diguanylate cyclase (GGDEF)-like protein